MTYSFIMTPKIWATPLVLSLLLIAIAQYDFLTFHLLAELFTIIISFMMFAVAWNTSKYQEDSLLCLLACGYFWVASIDLVHALTYPGMNLFVEGSANITSQFWLA